VVRCGGPRRIGLGGPLSAAAAAAPPLQLKRKRSSSSPVSSTPPQACSTCSPEVCNPACTGGGLAPGDDPCVCSGLLALFGGLDRAKTSCAYDPRPGRSPPLSYCGLSSQNGNSTNSGTRCSTSCDAFNILSSVTFAGQDLAAFPPEAAALLGASVQTLDLSDNALTDLPGELRDLAGLTGLVLAGNRVADLGGLAEALVGLPTLVGLELARNRIQSLPGASLPKSSWRMLLVRVLDLSAQDPKLASITPKFLKHLAQVQSLLVQSNALTSLPRQVSKLTGLATLDASGQEGGRFKLPGAFRCSNKLVGLGTCDVSNNPSMNCGTVAPDSACCASCLTNGGKSCAKASRTCNVLGGNGNGGGRKNGEGDEQGAIESV